MLATVGNTRPRVARHFPASFRSVHTRAILPFSHKQSTRGYALASCSFSLCLATGVRRAGARYVGYSVAGLAIVGCVRSFRMLRGRRLASRSGLAVHWKLTLFTLIYCSRYLSAQSRHILYLRRRSKICLRSTAMGMRRCQRL